MIKTDPAGDVMWEKTYGGNQYDFGNSIIQTADGGLAIAGTTESLGAGGADFYLLKIDPAGNELWSKAFGGPKDEEVLDIKQTADGGYILVGATQSFGAGSNDVYLVKTDASGSLVWSQQYGTANDDLGWSVYQTANGGYFILGTVSYSSSDQDVYLIQVDAVGQEEWSRIRTEKGVQTGYAMVPTADGNYLITGLFDPTGAMAQADFLLLKVDPKGHDIWSKVVGNDSISDYGITVIETADGGFLATGMSMKSTSAGGSDIPLVKTDAHGAVLWMRNINVGGHDVGRALLQAADGGYALAGFVTDGGERLDAILMKLDGDGNVAEKSIPAKTSGKSG